MIHDDFLCFSKKKSKKPEELKITKFPTFLLIDKNRNIVYRGSSAVALIEIEKIINYK